MSQVMHRFLMPIRGYGVAMKVPFRQQVSDYDCVPTSLINALCYLFHRKDIPPFVVYRAYKDCLDAEASRGTSSRAIQDIGFWLNNYQEKKFSKFAVESKYISGDQVHLKESSKILRFLDSNGVALLYVNLNRNIRHCILGLWPEDGWIYCYDPSPLSKRFIDNDAVQLLDTPGKQDPNVRIRFNWLEKNLKKAKNHGECKYVFGNKNERECLLLNRIRE
jgi:hypothetical protein